MMYISTCILLGLSCNILHRIEKVLLVEIGDKFEY